MIERTLCRFTPPRRCGGVLALAALLLTLGLSVWAAAPVSGLGALLRFAALVPFSAGLYLAMRWLARVYIYTLEAHERGAIDFVVTERLGRRTHTVCRVDSADLLALRPLPRKARPARTDGPCCRYCNEPRPAERWLLILRNPIDGEPMQILFTPDPPLRTMLAALLPPANQA